MSVFVLQVFRTDVGGDNIKINVRHIIVAIVILLFLGFIFYFVNSFTGNPVSAFIASHKIQDYAAVTYPTLDLELSEVKYNFKNSAYGCYAQSKKVRIQNFISGIAAAESAIKGNIE